MYRFKSCFALLVVPLVLEAVLAFASSGDPAMSTRAEMRSGSFSTADVQALSRGHNTDPFKQNDCGLRSLALFAALNDRRAQYTELRRLLPPGPDGVSMLQIKRAAVTIGISLTVVRCPPNKLNQLPVPAIAQVEANSIRGAGHFLVIFGVDETDLQVCDATTGVVGKMARSDFLRETTGYFLIASRSSGVGWWLSAAALCVFAVTASRIGARSQRGAVKNSVLPIPVIGALIGALLPTVGCAESKVAPEKPRLIRVDAPVGQLGVLASGQTKSHRFRIDSLVDRPLRLNAASTSCGCLSLKFEPSPDLPPRGSTHAVLTIVTDPNSRPPGPILENALIQVVDYWQSEHLILEGLLPGVVCNEGAFRVHPKDLSGEAPLWMTLWAFLPDEKTELKLRDLSCSSTQFTTAVSDAERSVPERQTPLGYRQRIRIPVTLHRPVKSEISQVRLHCEIGQSQFAKAFEAIIRIE